MIATTIYNGLGSFRLSVPYDVYCWHTAF